MSKILSRPPYGNCKVLDNNGDLMFRCDERKTNWYLQRGLAKIISDNPCTIQLMFKPNGLGHVGDEFFLQEKPNDCVVCGSTDHLTKHHIVPRGYRKFFPDELKSHQSYDVVVMCIQCHETYEHFAFALKQVIATEHGCPVHGSGMRINKELCRARFAASALLNHRHKMPPARIEELLDRLREHYDKDDITEEDLQAATAMTYLSKNDFIYHGKYVVDHTDDIDAFIKRWRKHFIDTMQPKYLPPGWEMQRTIRKTTKLKS